MALSCFSSYLNQAEKTLSSLLVIFNFFLFLLHNVNSVSFNFTNFANFQSNTNTIKFQGDAFPSNGVLQLTKNQLDGPITGSVGRASYAEPVRLWDAKTGKLTDFTTHFSFIIKAVDETNNGDGITFFIAPVESTIPINSSGGFLALFNPESAFNTSKNQIVAVEFDSNMNLWDPSFDHIGIIVNSIVSVTNLTWKTSIKKGATANAWISYNSTSKNFTVFLTYADKPVFNGSSSLSYLLDLKKVLPEWVRIGFSASTGSFVEIHNILSWSFNSTLETSAEKKNKNKIGLVIGLVGAFGFLFCAVGLFWFIFWRKRDGSMRKENKDFNASMNDEFEKGTGPKRFTYRELSRATNEFSEGGKLGEGGFGGVYKGLLVDSNTEVAVKKVSKGSKQGKKEYISEVRIISRLRHRNLVQLLGWCHEKGEFLLVYELLPNGSLDSHLFGRKIILSWTVRYKVALGLASALLYLHEEWEQCVVHRDIKSSNIMLDANFNAKLGDFGLARLVDHELGSQTTVLAGTMGYLAPECVTTGKASKESDVYSFGVVALEITCGRRPVEAKAEPSTIRLVEWVWDLYGKGQVLEAVDKRLSMEFDENQIECLMVVGLWCCHPDPTVRPSIRQVINVLNFEAPLPSLPSKLPVPMYFAPPMNMCRFSYTSSGFTSLVKDRTQCSCSSCSTYSSTSAGSRKALLYSQKTVLEA
ncbi:Lectin receptor kinase [Quillaja saponaria]|uniref:non-specific serine/threonine protein kinase n=1 Tax=Quillaja saponaria TaxID=32244 RepID=A0AAD7L9C3_QUISA|nr:Lectin receptor kinase [Quillaja saponaria]